MRKRLLLLVCIPILVLACTSTNDSFLIKTLDSQAKADALVNAGMDEYDQYLVQNQAFDQIPRIRQYFATALQFDPENDKAQQYLDLVDNFKTRKLQTNLDKAATVLAKPKRTEDESYVLAVSLQTAAKIDPKDAHVQKMLTDTAQERTALAASYMDKSQTALKDVNEKTPPAAREKKYTDSYQYAVKALNMDAKNAMAQKQVEVTKAELTKMVSQHVDSINKLITAKNYSEARTQVKALNELNQALANAYDAEIQSATYSLNYSWAAYLFTTKKDYNTARVRVDAALNVRRTDEATALKKKILAAGGAEEGAASFDAALKEIDRLIGSGDLLGAHSKILAAKKATKDADGLAKLADRDKGIVARLKDVYDQGVQAYRDEDFKTAITKLKIVVGVQSDYEQASDYLNKAQSKQKVLDSLGGEG
jgi:hypothetical protein